MINFQTGLQQNIAFSAKKPLQNSAVKAPKGEDGKIDYKSKVGLLTEQNDSLKQQVKELQRKLSILEQDKAERIISTIKREELFQAQLAEKDSIIKSQDRKIIVLQAHIRDLKDDNIGNFIIGS